MKPHFLHVFSTFVAGGPQVRTARLLNAYGADYRHTIVPLDGRTEAQELFAPEVPFEVLPQPKARGTFAMMKEMRALFRAQKPDLVLTYNWGAIEAVMAARSLAGLTLLHHEDGFRPDELDGFKKRRIWTRRLVLKGLELIVPSHTLFEIATGLWRLEKERVHWIPNGIEVADFPTADGNAERRKELGIPTDALVLGSVGHLRGEKNPVRFVEAVALVESEREAHVLMLGDGPERAAVESAVARLGLEGRVHLVGHRQDTAGDYRTMDVFLLSSDTEQMPVALLEAMAAGLPVVSTDVGDVRRILPEVQREFVTGESAAELAEGLTRLLKSDGSALGSANQARVRERFSFDGMVAAYRERFEAALGVRGRG